MIVGVAEWDACLGRKLPTASERCQGAWHFHGGQVSVRRGEKGLRIYRGSSRMENTGGGSSGRTGLKQVKAANWEKECRKRIDVCFTKHFRSQ